MANNIKRRLDHVLAVLNSNKLADLGTKEYVKLTPVKSGNARRNTRQHGNQIEADYPYATLLDEGYSKQAPNGMSKPTLEYLRNYIYQQTGVRIK